MTLPAADIVALYQSDSRPTCAELAARYGVSEATVRRLLDRAGILRRAPGRARRTRAERAERYAAIVETLSTGLSVAATAALHRVPRSTVYLAMTELRHLSNRPFVVNSYRRKIRRVMATTAILPLRSYDQLVAAMISRRRDLGLPQLEVDYAAGLQTGYTSKLELAHDMRHGKRGGIRIIAMWAAALGYDLALVEREAPP